MFCVAAFRLLRLRMSRSLDDDLMVFVMAGGGDKDADRQTHREAYR